jgi:hypothetical protein
MGIIQRGGPHRCLPDSELLRPQRGRLVALYGQGGCTGEGSYNELGKAERERGLSRRRQ